MWRLDRVWSLTNTHSTVNTPLTGSALFLIIVIGLNFYNYNVINVVLVNQALYNYEFLSRWKEIELFVCCYLWSRFSTLSISLTLLCPDSTDARRANLVSYQILKTESKYWKSSSHCTALNCRNNIYLIKNHQTRPNQSFKLAGATLSSISSDNKPAILLTAIILYNV